MTTIEGVLSEIANEIENELKGENMSYRKSNDTSMCQRHKVTRYRCQRKAVITRITSAGVRVKLCRKCDETFGNVIGKRE